MQKYNLSNLQTGTLGENLAIKYLKKLNYKILERNYRIIGGEIDIVCKDKDYLVFVEVKTRYSHEFGLPSESITSFKIKALLKTALFYIQKINWGDKGYRIDLITVDFSYDPKNPKIELIKDITS